MLKADQLPNSYEGEIQCSIEWEDGGGMEANNITHNTGSKSVIT